MNTRNYRTKSDLAANAIACLLVFTGASHSALASDRGQLLYENHCQSCHDKSVHTRSNRLATSPEQLRAWVMSWSMHNGLFWGEEEIADITDYLDRTLYHFTE